MKTLTEHLQKKFKSGVFTPEYIHKNAKKAVEAWLTERYRNHICSDFFCCQMELLEELKQK